LAVENVTESNISLSWKPPTTDGGSMITNYIVEKLNFSANLQLNNNSNEAPAEVHQWTRCSMTKNTYFIDELVEPLHKYQYRVIAQNLQGRSLPCEPTSVITTPDAKSRTKRWVEDETGRRRRGKDGFVPSDYDKCCKS
jgi:hypothetical protein